MREVVAHEKEIYSLFWTVYVLGRTSAGYWAERIGRVGKGYLRR